MAYSTKLFPLVLKVENHSITFYGALWIFKFRREWLEEIIVDTGGFIFKPKLEHSKKYRRVTELTSGDWKGYKVISFINPKGLAEFVKVMRPITGDRIDWDRMSEKRKEYWWKMLYGSGND